MSIDNPSGAASPPQLPSVRLINGSRKSRGRRPHGPIKPKPFSRADLDGRTHAAQTYDRLFAEIARDAGGEDRISAIQRELIVAFCAVSLRMNDLSTRSLIGQTIELADLSLAASTLTRLASRIGIARTPRQDGMTLGELRRHDLERHRRESRIAREAEQVDQVEQKTTTT
jgi:hypothetical protein